MPAETCGWQQGPGLFCPLRTARTAGNSGSGCRMQGPCPPACPPACLQAPPFKFQRSLSKIWTRYVADLASTHLVLDHAGGDGEGVALLAQLDAYLQGVYLRAAEARACVDAGMARSGQVCPLPSSSANHPKLHITDCGAHAQPLANHWWQPFLLDEAQRPAAAQRAKAMIH